MPLGIENLKLALKFIADFTVQVAQTKKFKLLTVISFFDDLIAFGGVLASWKEIEAEFNDLTPAEQEQLYQYANENLDIPHEQTKAFVADSFKWAMTTFSLVQRAKQLAK